MEKIDLILYLLLALLSLILSSAIVRVYEGYYRNAHKLYDWIQRLMDKGEFQKALEICSRHLKKRPADAQLLWFRAKLLFKLENFREAQSAFEEIVKNEPAWADEATKFIDNIKKKI